MLQVAVWAACTGGFRVESMCREWPCSCLSTFVVEPFAEVKRYWTGTYTYNTGIWLPFPRGRQHLLHTLPVPQGLGLPLLLPLQLAPLCSPRTQFSGNWRPQKCTERRLPKVKPQEKFAFLVWMAQEECAVREKASAHSEFTPLTSGMLWLLVVICCLCACTRRHVCMSKFSYQH